MMFDTSSNTTPRRIQ